MIRLRTLRIKSVISAKDLRGYLRTCCLGSAHSVGCAGSSSAASVFISHSDDTALKTGPFDHWALAQQKGSQNREDKCSTSSQEMCGNKVSTCHCCEMQLAAFDNGLPRRATALCTFCDMHASFHFNYTILSLIISLLFPKKKKKGGDNSQGDCEHLNALLIQGLNSAPN